MERSGLWYGRADDARMQLFNGISLIIFTLATLVVGTSLVRSSQPGAPERLLGASFLVTIVGHAIVTFALDAGVIPPRPAWFVTQGGAAVVGFGFAMAAEFVRRVFRPHAVWAMAFTRIVGFAMVAMPLANMFLDHPNLRTIFFTPEAILRTACYAWPAIEALRYHVFMRRRVRLGMTEPMVANRFLLWGLGFSLGCGMIVAMYAGRLVDESTRPMILGIGAACGLPAALLMWLSYFPTEGYRRWIERRAGGE